jgi:transcriptional regulator GlxA family with amidase domain
LVQASATQPTVGSFGASPERFEAVVAWLDGAVSARLSHAELEEQLQVDGRQLLRQLLQDHLDVRAQREQRLKCFLRVVASPG